MKTDEQIATELRTVANFKNKDEKMAWKRKRDAMERLIQKELEPLQEKILELNKERQAILDRLGEMRAEMVRECIHPIDYLVYKDRLVECKFCGVKIRVVENQ